MPVCQGVDARTALTCGDDYELLFTAADLPSLDTTVYRVGTIVAGERVAVLEAGRPLELNLAHPRGFRHFE